MFLKSGLVKYDVSYFEVAKESAKIFCITSLSIAVAIQCDLNSET